MTGVLRAQAGTGLSPEWDRWFDEAFTDLISGDQDLVRTEFDALIEASWQGPPPAPPAPSADDGSGPGPAGDASSEVPDATDDAVADRPGTPQRSPPD